MVVDLLERVQRNTLDFVFYYLVKNNSKTVIIVIHYLLCTVYNKEIDHCSFSDELQRCRCLEFSRDTKLDISKAR